MQQRGPGKGVGHAVARRDIGPADGRGGNGGDAVQSHPTREIGKFGDDGVIDGDRPVDQVHLVYDHTDMLHAQQGDQTGMPPRLGQHPLARIDQHHGGIGGRGPRHHVARILLVAGGVGDDELSPRRGEISIGHVDGDALLALGRQTIDQKREIQFRATRACRARIRRQRRQLIVGYLTRVVQQSPDQR